MQVRQSLRILWFGCQVTDDVSQDRWGIWNGWWMVDVLVHLKSNHPKVEPKTGDQGVAFSTMVIQCQYWRCDHFETTQRRHVRRCCEIQGREYVNLWAKAAWIVVILALTIWRMEDIVPDVGRCVIFRSRELWHETLPPRRKLWVAWKQIWSCSFFIYATLVGTSFPHLDIEQK